MERLEFHEWADRFYRTAYVWRVSSGYTRWHNGPHPDAVAREKASQARIEALVVEWAEAIRAEPSFPIQETIPFDEGSSVGD